MSKNRKVIYSGFLIALSIVFTRILSYQVFIGGVGAVRIGFGPLPILLGGILLGPVYGGIIGALADFLGYLLNPMGGGYLPIIALIAAARGIIPPLILRLTKKEYSFFWIFLAIGLTQLSLGLIAMPLVLYRWFGVPIWANVPVRLVTQLILIPIYTSIIYTLVNRIPKAIPSLGKP